MAEAILAALYIFGALGTLGGAEKAAIPVRDKIILTIAWPMMAAIWVGYEMAASWENPPRDTEGL